MSLTFSLLLFALCGAVAFAQPAPGVNTILYIEGIFDLSYPSSVMLADAKEIASSGFTTVILAFLHFHPGDCVGGEGIDGFVYNDNCFSNASVVSTLTSVMKILRDPTTSSVKTVLLSIGGAGCSSDFDGISQYWSTFEPSLTNFISTYKLDGIDLDLEDDVQPYLPVLEKLVLWGVKQNLLVTAVPASADHGWITLVTNTKNARKNQQLPGVSWLNLQTYGGGNTWVRDWATTLIGIVPNPQQFVLPGASASSGYGPTDMAQRIKSIKSIKGEDTNISGAFVWDYRMIKYYSGSGPSSNVTLWHVKMHDALAT